MIVGGIHDNAMFEYHDMAPSSDTKRTTAGLRTNMDRDSQEHHEMNGDINGRLNGNGERSSLIKIDIPSQEINLYPKEKMKTLYAGIFMFISWVMTTASLAAVHERMPDREKTDPLPDVIFDIFDDVPWLLDVSEVLIIMSMNTTFLILILHKHRFIVARRSFMIVGLLYMYRSITMFVTQLPVASEVYYCSPKANYTSFALIFRRVIKLMTGMGLSINGNHTYCGDYIYSGHTMVLTFSYLFISEYSPKKYWLLRLWTFCAGVVGVVCVVISRGHYTVDVVIAYYVTTTLFWVYHAMAAHVHLKLGNQDANYLARFWWFRLFEYFERNVSPGPLPRQYNWPLPYPRYFAKKFNHCDS